jgi:exosome complex component RRP4
MIKSEGKTSEERKIVVPGETIVSGEQYLPGDGAYRDGSEIVASRYGLAEVSDKFVKIIAVSGVYVPRRGNSIIGEIIGITFNGWLLNFGGAENAFLSMMEVPRYINKGELREHFDFGDLVSAKVWNTNGRGIDLSVKMRGFGKLEGGQLMKINPNKVPRIIGREGSMVNLIKDATTCEINVGQNGWVWIKSQSDNIDNEIQTRKIIDFICENSTIVGLTEKVEKFIKNMGIKKEAGTKEVEIIEEDTHKEKKTKKESKK